MNVMFFISVHSHGRGGHINSLHHIVNKLAKNHNVSVISIGPGSSSFISQNTHFRKHIYFNGVGLLGLKRQCDILIKQNKPQIIHCFDAGVYNIIRLLYSSTKIKIALNLCGGPNPRKFPYVKNLVLFSVENKQWFEKDGRYKKSNIALIPNRVSTIQTKTLDIPKEDEYFTFVRIARIGKAYKKSIIDSINLIELLLKRNSSLKIKLFIIGVVECQNTFSELLKTKLVNDSVVIILTEERHTMNASKMLYLADAVIGTGRGIMEAASLGLPTLTINSLNNTPVLITSNTFYDAFRTNFSERNVFSKVSNEENITEIEKLISDKNFYNELSLYVEGKFKKYFDIEYASSRYIGFYNDAELSSKRLIIEDSFLILKSLYNFFRSSKKIK